MICLQGGKFQYGPNICGFKIRKISEDLLLADTRCKKIKHILHADAHTANAWPAATLARIHRDSLEMLHHSIYSAEANVASIPPMSGPARGSLRSRGYSN